jgi:hypothetical protein
VRTEIEPLQNLANAHPLIDKPAVHRADEVRLDVIDDQVTGHTLAFGHIPVTVRSPTAQVLASSRLLQLAATEALTEECALVLRNCALNLEKQLIARIVANWSMDEHDLTTGSLELLKQKHLIDVLTRQPIRAEHDDGTYLAVLDGVTQTIQTRSIEPSAAVALVQEDVLRLNRVGICFSPCAEHGKLTVDGLFAFLTLGRYSRVDRDLH